MKRADALVTDRLGSLSELVEYNEWSCGGVADGRGDLVEVDGERWQVGGDALGGPDTCEDLVDDADLCCVGWNVATDESHEHHQSHLHDNQYTQLITY